MDERHGPADQRVVMRPVPGRGARFRPVEPFPQAGDQVQVEQAVQDRLAAGLVHPDLVDDQL
ncbi:hypothetical protein AB0I53_13195 [Saccharopolyspora sp. NPDC050389]|uniref:hypothetical protein n=1 Tax=Saccharopolyspora sp. NPDC050389 TaxID=3155516 RepID=UPI0033D6E1F6